jgi:hypothetical protein
LWAEWQDRRRTLQTNLHMLDQQSDHHVTNLDSALTIISRIGVYHERLTRQHQKGLLRLMVKRIVVDVAGLICGVELQSPFAYLFALRNQGFS